MFLYYEGGYFGAGWLRDVWRIPSYVREANDDPDYIRDLTDKMRSKKKPPLSVRTTTNTKCGVISTDFLVILFSLLDWEDRLS